MDIAANERDLVRRILSGETDRFRDLVTEYKGLVFHVVRGLVPNESDHEDVAQDVFIKVYRNLPVFRFRSGLATWISRIAYRTCLNYLRRKRANGFPQKVVDHYHGTDDWSGDVPEPVNSAAGSSPYAVLCEQEVKQAVHVLIAELTPKQRLILTLFHLHGFGIPELTELTGMPAGTIKSHLFRARAQLRNKLLARFQPEDLIG